MIQDLSEHRIPASRRAVCVSCGEAVDTGARSTFQRACGWIQRGGHLVLAERAPQWMCRPCVDRLKVGAPVHQIALFDERQE